MAQEIFIKINGEVREVFVRTDETLLEVVRDKLGVKSPKCGCDRGDCGACTVILDGRCVRSCLVLAVEADGHDVVTLEGLGSDYVRHLQEVMIETNAFQCGFCAPGVILTLSELLERNPHPDRHDIAHELSGNLCRCTGYLPIIEATLSATKVNPKLAGGAK